MTFAVRDLKFGLLAFEFVKEREGSRMWKPVLLALFNARKEVGSL